MPAMNRFDVSVVGSGAVASGLALALAQLGLQVAITAPPSARADDVRAFALNAASRALLSQLKVWQALPPDALTAVHDMQVAGDAPRAGIEFSAWQQRVEALAWIVDARALEAALALALQFAPHVQAVSGPVAAALTVWADGRHSAAHAADLSTAAAHAADLSTSAAHAAAPTATRPHLSRHAYGQTALAARVVGDTPHQHTAWQWFRAPDVLALLPFDRPQPQHSFALVWSLPTAQANALQHASTDEFERELNRATQASAGKLRLASERAAWPLSLARAEPLCGPGWLLIGDAAHVVHPLAGQGLNLGLADVASLAQVLARREPWRGLGDERLLHRHVRARAMPTQAMAQLTDGLQQLFAHPQPWVRAVRNQGMSLLNHLAPIKRALTQHALDA